MPRHRSYAVKRIAISLMTIAMLATAWPAAAQFRQRDDGRGYDRYDRSDRFDRGDRFGRRSDVPVPAPQRGDMPPARQAGWPGHMSQEERRQLRRDIGEHGRELYRDRRDRR
jgi:hypothetical protein